MSYQLAYPLSIVSGGKDINLFIAKLNGKISERGAASIHLPQLCCSGKQVQAFGGRAQSLSRHQTFIEDSSHGAFFPLLSAKRFFDYES